MRARFGILGIAVCAVLALSACGNVFGGDKKDPKLLNIRSASRSPDEFTILPTKPLQLPEDLMTLPEPTPGYRLSALRAETACLGTRGE